MSDDNLARIVELLTEMRDLLDGRQEAEVEYAQPPWLVRLLKDTDRYVADGCPPLRDEFGEAVRALNEWDRETAEGLADAADATINPELTVEPRQPRVVQVLGAQERGSAWIDASGSEWRWDGVWSYRSGGVTVCALADGWYGPFTELLDHPATPTAPVTAAAETTADINADTLSTLKASRLCLPWKVQDLHDDHFLRETLFPWGVVSKWGVIVGRFDRQDQAEAVVAAINSTPK